MFQVCVPTHTIRIMERRPCPPRFSITRLGRSASSSNDAGEVLKSKRSFSTASALSSAPTSPKHHIESTSAHHVGPRAGATPGTPTRALNADAAAIEENRQEALRKLEGEHAVPKSRWSFSTASSRALSTALTSPTHSRKAMLAIGVRVAKTAWAGLFAPRTSMGKQHLFFVWIGGAGGGLPFN